MSLPSYATAFAALLGWYRVHGRAELPWRRTRDPYAILVSEAMLQQTQVERVRPAYEAFIARWPDFGALAAAARADVVRAWAGLGYNSRAVRLHALAVAVVERGGMLPRERAALLELPGIGPYTASAVRAFAFEAPDVALDTNLRRVLHRVGIGLEIPPRASDAELVRAALRDIDGRNVHDVNSALMDLGATICTARTPRCLTCPLRAHCAAAPLDAASIAAAAARTPRARGPQATLKFERTTRFLRGRIIDALRALDGDAALPLDALCERLSPSVATDRFVEVPGIVDALARDGIVQRDERGVRLA